ncbi:MAG: ABC transporter permease, partial [Armatimonadetes bacterium]|nr:ABC transporter permease [Candidatus Hippobium faecium]
YLLYQFVMRDLKVRYKNSALGFFWSLFNPLLQVATITIVVRYIMRVDIPNYTAYLLVAFLPWQFVLNGLLDSSDVLVHNRDMIKKVPFPREILPLSSVASNLIHFLLAMVIFVVYVLVYWLFFHGSPMRVTFLMFPVLVFMQTVLVGGIALFVCSVNAFFEDTKYILQALLNIGFYLTPIMYPVELVQNKLENLEWLYKLYMLSPFSTIMDAYRKLLLPPFEGHVAGSMVKSLPFSWGNFALCFVICMLIGYLGYRYFVYKKDYFAERL